MAEILLHVFHCQLVIEESHLVDVTVEGQQTVGGSGYGYSILTNGFERTSEVLRGDAVQLVGINHVEYSLAIAVVREGKMRELVSLDVVGRLAAVDSNRIAALAFVVVAE